jgi:HPt (histidine-containing phosphotransfer) domain-containing protein
MNDYVAKPFTPDDLYQKLFKKLKIVPSSDSVSLLETKTKHFDLNYLKTISGNNREFIREMVQTFVLSIPQLLTNMENALSESDWVTISRIAHQVKPSLTLMGIHQLKESAVQIEEITESQRDEASRQKIKSFIQSCRNVIAELTEEVVTL